MASKNFQERFKNRYSTISQDGAISINPERAIIKPSPSQLHSTVIKTSANSIINSGVISPAQKYSLQNSDYSFYGSASVAYTEPAALRFSTNLDEPSNEIVKRANNQSALPLRNKDSQSLTKEEFSNKTFQKNIQYKPYTLKDYNIIKPTNYYQLGGLGPSNIGTDD